MEKVRDGTGFRGENRKKEAMQMQIRLNNSLKKKLLNRYSIREEKSYYCLKKYGLSNSDGEFMSMK